MKAYINIKDETGITEKIERANTLLKELSEIFDYFRGLGRGVEIEIVPAQDNALALEVNYRSDS